MSYHLYQAIRANGSCYFFHDKSLADAIEFAPDAVRIIDTNDKGSIPLTVGGVINPIDSDLDAANIFIPSPREQSWNI